MNKTFEVKYLVIPDFVFNNEKLTLSAMKVYAFIHNYRMPEFFYGNDRLAELFNCSIPTITRAISQLEEEGYITTTFDGRKRFIQDNYVTHRVIKIDEADSSPMITPPQAGDSSSMITLNEASTAHLIRKDNKNNLSKNFSKKQTREGTEIMVGNNLTPSQKKAFKEQRRRLYGFRDQGRGFPPSSGFTPSYEKKERTGVHAEDVV